jgi:Fe(3+) dicitrate transport protein
VDLVGNYPVNDILQVYARVENIFDEQVIVSRSPAGARPIKPRSFIAGLALQF